MSVEPFDARSSAVQRAAAWLRDAHPLPSPIIPVLRERFGLTAKEAVQAIQAKLQQGRGP